MSQIAKEILKTIKPDGQSPAVQGNWSTSAAWAVEVVFHEVNGTEQQIVLSPWYFDEGEEAMARSRFSQQVEQAKQNAASLMKLGIEMSHHVRLYQWDLGPEVIDAFQS